ncbi:MAG: chaperone modulator CbpM [Gammaproteobacteria bacterium]|jgi:chaperone modulatory protein CbpM
MARREVMPLRVTLRELCEIAGAPADFVLEMVEFGIIEPVDGDPKQWQFGEVEVRRSRRAVNLMRDFGINMEGLSLALDLLDELDANRRRVRVLERLLREL